MNLSFVLRIHLGIHNLRNTLEYEVSPDNHECSYSLAKIIASYNVVVIFETNDKRDIIHYTVSG